jgi:hypothetical protein
MPVTIRLLLCSTALLSLATAADAGRQPIASGDFGASTAQGLPDGTDDLVWLDTDTGEVWVQFLSPSGMSVLRLRDIAGIGATPILGEGAIANVQIVVGGDDYQAVAGTGQLVVDNTNTGGSGLAGTFNVTGSIAAIRVLDGGHGYHDTGVVTLNIDETGTGGSGMDFLALSQPGDVTSVRRLELIDGGEGYEAGTELAVINANFLDSTAYESPVAGIANVSEDGIITSVDLVEFGSGFLETPALMLLGSTQGGGAEIQAFLGGAIYEIIPHPTSPNPGGDGYFADPILTPATAGGSDFDYEIIREGAITEVVLTSSGFNYQVPPVVDGDAGTGAVLESVVFADQDVWPAGEVPARTSTARVFNADGQASVLTNPSRGKWACLVLDLDGDGDSDLLWRSSMEDTVALWLFDDGVVVQETLLPAPGAVWKLAAAQDLNNEGGAELVWSDRSNGEVIIWIIDRDQPDLLSLASGPLHGPVPGRGYGVMGVLESPDGGPRLVWRHHSKSLWMTTQLDESDPTSIVEIAWFANSAGELWMPSGSDLVASIGDVDGDDLADDLVLVRNGGRQKGMVQAWRTEDGVILSDDILTWQSRTMRAHRSGIGLVTHNDKQESTIAMRAGKRVVLYRLPIRSPIAAIPDGALTDLHDALLALADMEGLDQTTISQAIDDFIDDIDDIDDADTHLQRESVRSMLLAGLPMEIQLQLELAMVDAFGEFQRANGSTSTAINMAVIMDADGNATAITPGILNRHYDYLHPGNEYQYGGPDGNSGSSSGSSGGGSSGSSGSTGNTGGTGGTGGSGGSGGTDESTGLPENFDPNDPDTWPEGVDTFQELVEYLQNLGL